MKFKGKIIKISKISSGIVIPKAYIDNGQLNLGQIYEIEVIKNE
mgnify:CR=1 FL=1